MKFCLGSLPVVFCAHLGVRLLDKPDLEGKDSQTPKSHKSKPIASHAKFGELSPLLRAYFANLIHFTARFVLLVSLRHGSWAKHVTLVPL